MTGTDIISLLNELWEHFDKTADVDSDGSPNASLRFCSEIDDAVKTLTKMRRDLYTVAGQIDNWKQDVAIGIQPMQISLTNGKKNVSKAISVLEGRS